MKITILSQYYFPEIGAAANRWTDYSKLLAEMGNDVTVICEKPNYPLGRVYEGYENKKSEIIVQSQLRIIRTWVIINKRNNNIKRILYFVSFMFSSLLSGLKLSKPDVLIASSPPLFVGITGWVLSKYYKIPLVTDIRDLWPESAIVLNELTSPIGKQIGYIMQNTVYKNTSLFLTAVPGFKKFLMKNIYAKNKPMLPLLNGIGEDLIQHCKNEKIIDYKHINIIYAGNIGLAQNLKIILETARKLDDNFQFKIIGDGVNKEYLVSLAKYYGLTNVQFKNSLSTIDLINEYQQAHIGIVCLHDNALFRNAIPSKTFEYMAFGLAVFCLVKGEIEKIIYESQAGKCCNPENENDLVEKIKNITKNELKLMGQAGKKYVVKNLRKSELIKSVVSKIEVILK